MSSILDALRKLEEEKAQHHAAPETPLPIEPQTREPAPRRTRARQSRQQSNPKVWMAAAGAIFVLGIIWAAVTTGNNNQSGDEGVTTAAAVTAPMTMADDAEGSRDAKLERIEADLRVVAEATLLESTADESSAPVAPAPEANSEPVAPVVEAAPTPEPASIEPESVTQAEPVQEPVTANRTPIQVDVTPVTPEPEPAPAEEPILEGELAPEMEPIEEPIEMARAANPPPLPEPRVEETAPARREPSENYRRVMEATEVFRSTTTFEPEPEPKVEEDIRRYDIMTRTVRARYDIPELNINMLMLPNDANPQPSALINYDKVYVGEDVPGTNGRVRLVGVEIRGIAVEVEGKRYYYPK